MPDKLLSLLGRLDAATGVSGEESAVAEVIADELAGHHDTHDSDPLGNHFFTRTGTEGAPTVMLCAHMDELGFIVQHVEDEGFVRIGPVGYHDDRMVIDQDLRIHGHAIEAPVFRMCGDALIKHVALGERSAHQFFGEFVPFVDWLGFFARKRRPSGHWPSTSPVEADAKQYSHFGPRSRS